MDRKFAAPRVGCTSACWRQLGVGQRVRNSTLSMRAAASAAPVAPPAPFSTVRRVACRAAHEAVDLPPVLHPCGHGEEVGKGGNVSAFPSFRRADRPSL